MFKVFFFFFSFCTGTDKGVWGEERQQYDHCFLFLFRRISVDPTKKNINKFAQKKKRKKKQCG